MYLPLVFLKISNDDILAIDHSSCNSVLIVTTKNILREYSYKHYVYLNT